MAARDRMKNVVCTLGFGNKYLRWGVTSLLSAHKQLGDSVDYVLFYGGAELTAYEHLDFLTFENIDLICDRKIDPKLVKQNHFLARKFKSIPLTHHKYIDRKVIMLDADILILTPKLSLLFKTLDEQPVVTFTRGYNEGETFDWIPQGTLAKAVASEEYHIENVKTHTAIVGRSTSEKGILFSLWWDKLLKESPITFKGKYFNDEPLAGIALQMSTRELLTSAQAGSLFPYDKVKHATFVGKMKMANCTEEAADALYEDGSLHMAHPDIIHFIAPKPNPLEYEPFYKAYQKRLFSKYRIEISQE